MANYSTLKAAIADVIKTNGTNAITGALLQQSLLAMVDSLGANFQFGGIATPSTNPGTPDQNVFYIATKPGTYTNFGGIELVSGETAILTYNGSWNKQTSGLASLDGIGEQLNLLGLPFYTLDAYINISTGAITNYGTGNYKTLIAPVVPSKEYKYYCSNSGGPNSGAMYGFYDELLNVITFAPIETAGVWLDLTPPSGAKYFCACIQFANQWSEAVVKQSCLIEKNKWFQYLESLAKTVQNDFSTNPRVFADQQAKEQKISRSLFESGFSFISKLGITDKYYYGYIGYDGTVIPLGTGAYKVLIAKVVAGKTYKLFISNNNTPVSDCGIYSFFDGDIFTAAHCISVVTNTRKGQWIDIVAPQNAQYFAACLEFNNTGDIYDSCFIEKNKWVALVENNFQQITQNKNDIQDLQKIVPAFELVSKNLYDGKTLSGWLSPENGSLIDTSAQGDRYVSTDFIPVKPNTFYSLTGRSNSLPDSAASGYGADKSTAYLLLKRDGSTPSASSGGNFYIWTGNNRTPNGIFKTDANTHFIRFTIRFNNTPSEDWTKIMLEEIGPYYDDQFTPSDYQPFSAQPIVVPESLPQSVSILRGKKIAYNGDSFCESRLSGFANNGGAYAVLIAEATGCTFENRAISGGILSNDPNYPQDARRVVLDVENMAADADLICFEGGINDWSSNVPLGTFNKTDYTSQYDEETITGALESIFRQAINRWVGKPICFIICHKINAWATQKAAGTFWDVHDRMVEVCNKWSIPYYDAFLHSGLNGTVPAQNNAFLNGGSSTHPDGWHPDGNGYRKYYVPQLIKLFESLLQVNE